MDSGFIHACFTNQFKFSKTTNRKENLTGSSRMLDKMGLPIVGKMEKDSARLKDWQSFPTHVSAQVFLALYPG